MIAPRPSGTEAGRLEHRTDPELKLALIVGSEGERVIEQGAARAARTDTTSVVADGQKEWGWRRAGAWAGVAFVVLGVVSTFLYTQPPRLDSPPATMLRWVRDHRSGIDAGMIMGVFAALPLVWFVVSTKLRLEERAGQFLAWVAFGSGIAYAVFVGLDSLPAATLVYIDGQRGGIIDAGIARLLMDLYVILYAPGIGLLGVFLVALGLAGVGHGGAFSRVTSWACLVMGPLCALEVVPIMVNSSYHPGGWAVLGWGTTIGSLVVVLAVAIELTRSSGWRASIKR